MGAEKLGVSGGLGPLRGTREVEAYAHSRNANGARQDLRDHLEAVASRAAGFAGAFGVSDLAEAIGVWHDLGKYNPAWQEYLLGAEAGTRRSGSGPDHKATGACFAQRVLEPLALPVAGHHGGLSDLADVVNQLERWRQDGAESTLELAPRDLVQVRTLRPPEHVRSPLDAELLLRMLFSALVDADFLDTERHFEPGRQTVREPRLSLLQLWERFEAFHETLPTGSGVVQVVRSEVYEACLDRASLPPGIFRLTVPTGGGKTLSAMAFALKHALAHGLQRVIVAVPYTSITEQTATVYRRAFGDEFAVLEHHSALEPSQLDDQTEWGLWARLAAENWDAPVIVTTTVQLFESLFASSTRKARKLHRIVRSVIVLDEAQALPPRLLAPILDVVRALATNYGVSVVLCTATQPALDDAPGFRGLSHVRELAPDPPKLFSALRRVTYEIPGDGNRLGWDSVADTLLSSEQALAILNTIGDAQQLFRTMDDPAAFHLSTMLCGAHRRQVLGEVRRRLRSGEPCRLVSTQVVEAGVDVDFPLVMRAMGPLDRIVQAAGRCNREGRLSSGRLIVFRPAEGSMPPGDYRTATDQTAVELAWDDADMHDPALYERYFRALFGKLELDAEHIQELRGSLRYRTVSERFKMIADDTVDVIVPYDQRARRLIDVVRSGAPPTRRLFRRLQPYLVSVRARALERHRRAGMVEELPAGMLAWLGVYDQRLGLSAEHEVLYV